MNSQCPNCGSKGLGVISNKDSTCHCSYCGFTWHDENTPDSDTSQVIIEPVEDDGIELTNISIGRITKSNGKLLYHREKKSLQTERGVSTIIKKSFAESGGRIFHSDEQAVALCHKCSDLIFKDDFARSHFGHRPLCARCQYILDDKVYTRSSYWFFRISKALFSLLKIPFSLLSQLLSILFLKDKV